MTSELAAAVSGISHGARATADHGSATAHLMSATHDSANAMHTMVISS